MYSGSAYSTNIDIREFTTDKSVYGTPFTVDFNIRVSNSGNVHIRPLGGITIKNMFGKEVANVDFNSGFASILPNSIRKFSVEVKILCGVERLPVRQKYLPR